MIILIPALKKQVIYITNYFEYTPKLSPTKKSVTNTAAAVDIRGGGDVGRRATYRCLAFSTA